MTSRRQRQRMDSAAEMLRQIRSDDWTRGPDAMRSVEKEPSFTCPDCHAETHHPDDVKYAYCGRCHQFKCEPLFAPRCMEPLCPDFGDYDFGEATCPEEHALPPAWRDS